MTVLERWCCYRCSRGFLHARFLVTHLIQSHGEQPPTWNLRGCKG